MFYKNSPHAMRREDLDLSDPIERDAARCLTRRPGSYVLRADLDREKQAYKTALEKEPTTRRAGHTYVPKALKKPGWNIYCPQSLENWDPERNAMLWIVATYSTKVSSIEDVEAMYREFLERNSQGKNRANDIVTRLLKGKCHHGVANCSYCPECEKWHLETLDYLAALRSRVLAYEREEARLRQHRGEQKRQGDGAEREHERQDGKQHHPHEVADGKMSVAQAIEILGIRSGASEKEIQAAYSRLMKRVHPDAGGSDYFAKQLNAARDVLLG
jgi:hypothetical protein